MTDACAMATLRASTAASSAALTFTLWRSSAFFFTSVAMATSSALRTVAVAMASFFTVRKWTSYSAVTAVIESWLAAAKRLFASLRMLFGLFSQFLDPVQIEIVEVVLFLLQLGKHIHLLLQIVDGHRLE